MTVRRTLTAIIILLAAAAMTGAAFADSHAVKRIRAERWHVWWGQSTIGKTGATLWSQTPTSPDETHSSLITSSSTWGDQTISFTTTTLDQLREGSTPNPWEVGWVMFHFRDLANYYWFMVKTNGFELGKKQGSDTQIFLATGSTPSRAVGTSYQVRIQAQGGRIRVFLDGSQVVDYTDSSPLLSGSVGLYEEDSKVTFGNVSVSAL